MLEKSWVNVKCILIERHPCVLREEMHITKEGIVNEIKENK
jgi:hypothetical protein